MVFSTLFKNQIPNFPVYILTGQLMFNFFSESTNLAMVSIVENGSLIKKVYIPKYIFPLSKVLFSCVNFMFASFGLILIMLITGVKFKLLMILGFIPVVYLLFFCFGVGLILSTVASFFRDMFHLYGVLLTALTYLTPLFYPQEIIPEKYRVFMNYNPLYYYIRMFRSIFYEGELPSINLHLICIALSVISILIGILVFQKNERKFILYI